MPTTLGSLRQRDQRCGARRAVPCPPHADARRPSTTHCRIAPPSRARRGKVSSLVPMLRQHPRPRPRARAIDRVDLGREIGKFQMAMAVDEHALSYTAPRAPCAARQFARRAEQRLARIEMQRVGARESFCSNFVPAQPTQRSSQACTRHARLWRGCARPRLESEIRPNMSSPSAMRDSLSARASSARTSGDAAASTSVSASSRESDALPARKLQCRAQRSARQPRQRGAFFRFQLGKNCARSPLPCRLRPVAADRALAARADGRQQPARRVRQHQQHGARRRLFQHLEQRVGGVVVHVVGGVHHARRASRPRPKSCRRSRRAFALRRPTKRSSACRYWDRCRV